METIILFALLIVSFDDVRVLIATISRFASRDLRLGIISSESSFRSTKSLPWGLFAESNPLAAFDEPNENAAVRRRCCLSRSLLPLRRRSRIDLAFRSARGVDNRSSREPLSARPNHHLSGSSNFFDRHS